MVPGINPTGEVAGAFGAAGSAGGAIGGGGGGGSAGTTLWEGKGGGHPIQQKVEHTPYFHPCALLRCIPWAKHLGEIR